MLIIMYTIMKILKIGDIIIGVGAPKIIVPIVGNTKEAIIKNAIINANGRINKK